MPPEMPPLRILHCLRAPVGGLFRHVRDLAEAQAEMGHAVGVLCDSVAHDALTESRLAALRDYLALGLHRVPMSRDIGWRDVGAIRAARQLAHALRIDVLHGHGAKGGATARLATGITRSAPTGSNWPLRFYTPHGGSLHYDPRSIKGAVFMTLERQLAGLTDGIIFESAFAARRYLEKVGRPTCETRVVANGLRNEEFSAHVTAADATDLLFIGELRLLKGVDVLIDAIALLSSRRRISATVVGDGSDAALFQDMAREAGLADRIVFTGAMPAAEAFSRGRVMVVPSRAESLPYIVLEAAARAMPLVATDVGGIPEIVKGTDTSLVAPGNAARLAEALDTALADPAAAVARALRLQDVIRRRFTIEAMASNIVDFYRDVNATRLSEPLRA
ncbi:MAG: glycosyltransferase family 4 protein [Hyphomicrobiaceae bacterium]